MARPTKGDVSLGNFDILPTYTDPNWTSSKEKSSLSGSVPPRG